MRNILYKFYSIGFVVSIIIALGLFTMFYSFNTLMNNLTEELTIQDNNLEKEDIRGALFTMAQTISNAADFISVKNWDKNDILIYLTELLHNNHSFTSIYYGTKDNEMINASGWKPSDFFDLRERIWYRKASTEKKLIITEAFLNASRDQLIISIAKPVYNNNELVGVVGGDVSIESIIDIVGNDSSKNGYSFLIDSNGYILAHPEFEYNFSSELKHISIISNDIERHLLSNIQGTTRIKINNEDGYLVSQKIESTDWIVASFNPVNEHLRLEQQIVNIFSIILFSMLLIFILLWLTIKKYIISPIMMLDREVQKIKFEENINYRISSDKKDYFSGIRNSINNVLNTTEHYFKQLEFLSFHDQLTGLYNRRVFETELKRLDTSRNLPLTIVLADVNGLKLINDSFGHPVGDQLLKKVADIIKQSSRTDDIISRIGGDEFVLILPQTDSKQAENIVKRIVSNISEEKIFSINISVSFGWQTKLIENENILDILKKAEDYMYNKKLFEGPSMRNKAIKAIINTLHEKNKMEEQHSHRVSELCRKTGEALELSQDEITELGMMGLLHDIGKIAIDESILNKPDKLLPHEWKEIKRHPEIGYRILGSVTEMADMALDILSHHERWDGKGYPRGLKDLEISLKARIIAIADAYDAMLSNRPYRKALLKCDAVKELQKNAGIQFDPKIVKVFIEKVIDS